MSDSGPAAGWYYADGDPPGTQRYWDGATWQGEPQLAASEGQPPFSGYEGQAVGAGSVAATANHGPVGWYKESWRKYADFSGRARRAEYWWFVVGNAVVMVALGAIGGAVAGARRVEEPGLEFIPLFIFMLAILIPSLAVTVRRLHDISRSGWWYLLTFIPLGSFVILVFTFLDSKREVNNWGRSPKYG